MQKKRTISVNAIKQNLIREKAVKKIFLSIVKFLVKSTASTIRFLENLLSLKKNPLRTLEFARMLSPGHQRVAVHGNTSQKRAQQDE